MSVSVTFRFSLPKIASTDSEAVDIDQPAHCATNRDNCKKKKNIITPIDELAGNTSLFSLFLRAVEKMNLSIQPTQIPFFLPV